MSELDSVDADSGELLDFPFYGLCLGQAGGKLSSFSL